jgi:hypothetical protein
MQGRIAAWVFDNITLPQWAAPWVFGLIVGRMPRNVKEKPDAVQEKL